MLFEYGWPDNFHKDDFIADIGGMHEQWEQAAEDEENRLLEERILEAQTAALR